MKKTYTIEGLACAHCAAKIEESIQKLDGVQDVAVSFLTQKLVLEAEDENFDELLKKAAKICKRVEPGCKILA